VAYAGRAWIAPDGCVFPITDPDTSHNDWVHAHEGVLRATGVQIPSQVEFTNNTEAAEDQLWLSMFKRGWIRQACSNRFMSAPRLRTRVLDYVLLTFPRVDEIAISYVREQSDISSPRYYEVIPIQRQRESSMTDPLVLYHGSHRWFGPPEIRGARRGAAEHGPGIYLTTSWTTAKGYAKGGGAVQRVVLAPDLRWLQDARLDLEETLAWLRDVPRLRQRQELADSLRRLAARSGNPFPAEYLVNVFVNSDQASGQAGPALAKFLVDHGVDVAYVRQSNEDWVVVFNTEKIAKVTQLTPRDVDAPGFPFDTPRVRGDDVKKHKKESTRSMATRLFKDGWTPDGWVDDKTVGEPIFKPNMPTELPGREYWRVKFPNGLLPSPLGKVPQPAGFAEVAVRGTREEAQAEALRRLERLARKDPEFAKIIPRMKWQAMEDGSMFLIGPLGFGFASVLPYGDPGEHAS